MQCEKSVSASSDLSCVAFFSLEFVLFTIATFLWSGFSTCSLNQKTAVRKWLAIFLIFIPENQIESLSRHKGRNN